MPLDHRLYWEDGLSVRRKRKRVGAGERQLFTTPTGLNQHWPMDFVPDALSDGRKVQSLNIVDDSNRECGAVEVDTSLPGGRGMRWGELTS